MMNQTAEGKYALNSFRELSRRRYPGGLVILLACIIIPSGCGPNTVPEIRPKVEIKSVQHVQFSEDDWPSWRGMEQRGIAKGPAPPVKWSETENILWSSDIPGRGHSSPVVVGKHIFLTTADEKLLTQSVVCLYRKTGNEAWVTRVHAGGLDPNSHNKNSQASSTVVCDHERVFALFMFDSRVQLSSLDMNGNILWTKIVGNYVSKFGFASSPLLYGQLLIVAVDHSGGGYLAAVNRFTGDIYWRTARKPVDSYCTPSIFKVAGRDTLFIAGNNELTAYDPLSGTKLWSVSGTTEACVGSPVESRQMIFASGGYPGRETLSVQILDNGQPVVKWRNTNKSYVPSLLATKDLLFQVTDAGIASCCDLETGNSYWEARLGGDFSSSPVLAGEHIYLSNETGVTQVFKASKDKFERVAQNRLGNEQMASPAICGGRIYIRAGTTEGETRTERLYCIGESTKESADSGKPGNDKQGSGTSAENASK